MKRILAILLLLAVPLVAQDKRKPWHMFNPLNLYTKGIPVNVLWSVVEADTDTSFLVSADGDTLLSSTSDYLITP
jgi:hypothetical protein